MMRVKGNERLALVLVHFPHENFIESRVRLILVEKSATCSCASLPAILSPCDNDLKSLAKNI